MGSIGILNVGAGDTKLVFDNSDPKQMKESAKVVQDMIKRGYVLLIEVGQNEKGPIYQRALRFDEKTAEYIVAGTPPSQKEEKTDVKESPVPPSSRRKAAPQLRIRASSANGVGVAATAGG